MMKKIVFLPLIMFFSMTVPLFSMDLKKISKKRTLKSIDSIDSTYPEEADNSSEDCEITIIGLAKGILDSSYAEVHTSFNVLQHGTTLSVEFRNDLGSKVLSIRANKPRNFSLKVERFFSLGYKHVFGSKSIIKDHNFKKLYKIFSIHNSGLIPTINFEEKNSNYTDVITLEPEKRKKELSYFG